VATRANVEGVWTIPGGQIRVETATKN